MRSQQKKPKSKLARIITHFNGVREVLNLKNERHIHLMPKAKRRDFEQPRGHYNKSGNSVTTIEIDFYKEIEKNTSPDSQSDEISSPTMDQFEVNNIEPSWEYNDKDTSIPIDTYGLLMTLPSEETQDSFFPENDDADDLFRCDNLDIFSIT